MDAGPCTCAHVEWLSPRLARSAISMPLRQASALFSHGTKWSRFYSLKGHRLCVKQRLTELTEIE